MGLSELCIRRPVLTTLVTTTFIVFGIFAYRLLPVAALAGGRFPDHLSDRHLAGGERREYGGGRCCSDRAADGDDLGHQFDHVGVDARSQPDQYSVQPQPQYRRCRARCADRLDGRATPPAGRDDRAPELPQGEPGRVAGRVPQRQLNDPAVVGRGRIRRGRAGPADVADSRRRPGRRLWITEVRHPRAGRSVGGGGAQRLAR